MYTYFTVNKLNNSKKGKLFLEGRYHCEATLFLIRIAFCSESFLLSRLILPKELAKMFIKRDVKNLNAPFWLMLIN